MLRLLVTLPWLSLSMRLLGFRKTYRRLERRTRRIVATAARTAAAGSPDAGDSAPQSRPPGAGEAVPSRTDPVHVTALVVHVNRHVLPYQSKCLLESLALWHLLRRRGYAAELVLGTRTLLGPLEAHAWVELGGRVLNDDASVRDIYVPFEIAAATVEPDSP